MTSPFATKLLGWKLKDKKDPSSDLVPNCADVDSDTSLQLAAGMLDELGIGNAQPSAVPESPGSPLEEAVRSYLFARLPELDGNRSWNVDRNRVIADFAQYSHLKEIDKWVKKVPALRMDIGTDYLIKPDVTVALTGVPTPDQLPLLHAVVSCKWTIRSDRVQNVRHEFNRMIRHRRGRQPHLVAVTAEPMPTRLLSIARGTGEVDAVYHIAFDALGSSVEQHGNSLQKAAWEECVTQQRLLSFDRLAETLAHW